MHIKNKKEKLLLIILMAGLYGFHFLVMPAAAPQSFRGSNEGSAVFWISTAIATIIGYVAISSKFMDWLPANIIYGILPVIYSANGAYGFKYGTPDSLGIIYYAFQITLYLIYQALIRLVFFIGRKIAGWYRRRKNKLPKEK